MRINGHWAEDEDGLRRPVLLAKVKAQGGIYIDCPFLVDTGADRTVFSADIVTQLGLPTVLAARQLGGVGGAVETHELWTEIKFTRTDGGSAAISGSYGAFLDPAALEESVLGRDVFGVFTLVIDLRGNVVCLVRDNHRVVIQES